MTKAPKDIEKGISLIRRRGLILGGLMGASVTVLAMRLRSLQLDRAEEFRMLSDGNSIKIRLLPPARGLITDRNGIIIAGNEQNYRVTITREEAGDTDDVLTRLAHLIPLSSARRQELSRDIARRNPTTPMLVADHLTWREFSGIAVNAPALPGVQPEAGLSRIYPQKGDFAHVVGYVGPVSDYDLSQMESPDPVLRLPEFQLGKTGVESKLEEVLRGHAGNRRVEVNSAGREMRELSRKEGQQGATVQLTLDSALQNYCAQRLGEESAAAVVMDVRNGDVVAICSSPSFDPNAFVRGISGPEYRALMGHDHRPLADKTVQGLYPPGSTFKMIPLLAGLQSGIINGGTRFFCPGYLEFGGRRFHCWRHGGHGTMDPIQSLEQSCDVFYYELAQRVGIERISEMARMLGVGVRHDLPMSAVAEGIAPNKEWKLDRYQEEWRVGDSINASIGQGYVLASPLQLAVMTARIASGRKVVPRLVLSVDSTPQPVPEFEPLEIEPAYLDLARKGMDAVMNGSHGTALRSRIVAPEWRLAGKSGTSQVRNITAAERARGVVRNDQLPWNRRDHALFVNYAPYDAPRFAVSVVVEHGGSGGAVAAPIARDIMLFALNGGLPPLSAYPEGQRGAIQEMHDQMDLRHLSDETPAQPGGRSRA